MSSASSGETTRSDELDTILQFAEESSTREIFAKETELTQTWLSGNESPREGHGTSSRVKSNVTHTSVDINDTTTQRLDLLNDHNINEDLKTSDSVKNVETLQGSHDVNEIQEIERSTSDVSSKTTTSSTSTDQDKRSPTGTGTSPSTSNEEVGRGNKNDPVVAKVRRRREGGSCGPCSACKCSYFCRLTGILKLVEIIAMLLALIITVAVDGACYYSESLIIVNGVMLMGLTVTPSLLVCHLLKQAHTQRTLFEVLINGFLALYSVVAGCSVLGCAVHTSHLAVGVAMGLFLLVAGVAYGVDCITAILKYRD